MKPMTMQNANTMDPVGSVNPELKKQCVHFLNNLLANEYSLFTKTLSYHWNITGPRFHSLHVFLENQYKELLTLMDDVAERIRVLGDNPISRISNLANTKTLEDPLNASTMSDVMINDLFRDHLSIQEQIKSILKEEKIFKDDPGTEDFLVGVLKKHEMSSWMLKSHLS